MHTFHGIRTSRLALPLYRANRSYRRSHPFTTSASANPAEALVDWVKQNGANCDGVAVNRWSGADGGSGFGLQAAKSCSAGTPLITLPANLHLTYGNSTTDPRLMKVISQVPSELWGAKVALQLLAHRVQGEDFAPYIAALPIGFPGLPMFFHPDAVKALEYPPVIEQVKRRCRWLLSFAKDVLGPLKSTVESDPFNGVEVDANALGWALAAVTSRAFRTRGLDQPASMLPLIDMANHSFQPNAKISAAGDGSISMVAARDIEAGEPIVISYGRLNNDFLLLDYGFIVPDNPYDTVQLRFDRSLIEAAKAVANVGSTLSGDEEMVAALPTWQTKALESLNLSGTGANTEVSILQLHRDDTPAGCPVDARLLGGVRVLCAANAAELEGRSGVDGLGTWEAPISVRNEVATLRTLSGVALIALSQFSGNAENDIEILKKGVDPVAGSALSEDMQLAVRFRLEKKQLLSAALAALSKRLKELTEGATAATGSAGNKGKTKKGTKPAANATGKGFGR